MDLNSRGKIHYEPRVLVMRAHFEFLGKLVLGLIGISFIISIVSILIYFHYIQIPVRAISQAITIETAFIASLYSSTSLVLLIFSYVKLFKDIMFKKFQVFDKYLLIINGKKQKKIFFQEISKIKCGSMGPLITFKIKCSSGQSMRFSTMLERADYIVEGMLKFNAKLLAWNDFVNFRAKLLLSDHKFARFHETYYGQHSWMAFLYLAFLPIAFMSGLYLTQTGKMTIHSVFTYFIVGFKLVILINISLWTLYQFICRRMIEKKDIVRFFSNIKDKKRDLIFEKKIFRIVFSVFSVLCILLYFLVYQFELNRFELTFAIEGDQKKIQNLNINIMDTRFNCFECNYPVAKNDRVVILKYGATGKYIGRIVAVAGESVTLMNIKENNDQNPNRVVSQSDEIVIPPKHFAMASGPEEKMIGIIDSAQIYGKIKFSGFNVYKLKEMFSNKK